MKEFTFEDFLKLIGVSFEVIRKLTQWPDEMLLNACVRGTIEPEGLKLILNLTNDEAMAVTNAAWRYRILCEYKVFLDDPWDRFIACFSDPVQLFNEGRALFSKEGWRFCYPEYLWAHDIKGMNMGMIIVVRNYVDSSPFIPQVINHLLPVAISEKEQGVIRACADDDWFVFASAVTTYTNVWEMVNLVVGANDGDSLRIKWRQEGHIE